MVVSSIYRKGPDAPGLPFPRRHIAAYVVLGFAVAAVGMLLVPLLATEARTRIIPRLLEAGGVGMLPIVILHLIAPLTLAWLGDRLVRGRLARGASPGPIAALALAPVTIGLVAGALAFRSIVH